MADLRELLGGLGYDDVRTHLQSGNVVLASSAASSRVERELERAIAERFGFEVAVIVRTRDQLAAVIALDPLAGVAKDPARYLVNFLSAKPSAKAVRELSEVDVSPECFAVEGRELYAWHPNGVHRSKLNRLIERRLGVSATARNWKTVQKLLELADA